MHFKNLWPLLHRTFADWNDHEAPRLGAALSFYTILSLAPLIILVIAVVALAFGRSTAQDQILDQVQGMIGRDGAIAVRTVIEHAEKPRFGSSDVHRRRNHNPVWRFRCIWGAAICAE
jgi:membrane protein